MHPPTIQVTTMNVVVCARCATTAGLRKMPAPMMPLITTMTVSNSVSRRTYWVAVIAASFLPDVVRPVDIDEPTIRVDCDARYLLPQKSVLSLVVRAVHPPHLGRVFKVPRRAIGERERDPKRKDTALVLTVADHHYARVSGLLRPNR